MQALRLRFSAAIAIFSIAAVPVGNLAEARIQRSPAEVSAFKRLYPCPSTGLKRGACPGYHVDHMIALCAGGPDAVVNMQWLTVEDHRFKTLVDVRECRRQSVASPGI